MPTVNEIRSFPFNEEGLEQVRDTRDGKKLAGGISYS